MSLNNAQKCNVSVTMVLVDQTLNLCERLLKQGGEHGLGRGLVSSIIVGLLWAHVAAAVGCLYAAALGAIGSAIIFGVREVCPASHSRVFL
jgi:hypothetical protein